MNADYEYRIPKVLSLAPATYTGPTLTHGSCTSTGITESQTASHSSGNTHTISSIQRQSTPSMQSMHTSSGTNTNSSSNACSNICSSGQNTLRSNTSSSAYTTYTKSTSTATPDRLSLRLWNRRSAGTPTISISTTGGASDGSRSHCGNETRRSRSDSGSGGSSVMRHRWRPPARTASLPEEEFEGSAGTEGGGCGAASDLEAKQVRCSSVMLNRGQRSASIGRWNFWC